MLKFKYNIMTGMTYYFEPTAYIKKECLRRVKKYKQ